MLVPAGAEPQHRQRRRLANPDDRAREGNGFRAGFLGVSRAVRVIDAGDDGDPVTFRDPLAQASGTGHVVREA
jgi:hypothetical protein